MGGQCLAHQVSPPVVSTTWVIEKPLPATWRGIG